MTEMDEIAVISAEVLPGFTNIKTKKKPKSSKSTVFMTPEEMELKKYEETAIARYGRGDKVPVRGIKTKKLRENMKKMESRYKDAALKAQDAEVLLEEQAGILEAEGMERTFKFKQEDIIKEVDISTAKKVRILKSVTN